MAIQLKDRIYTNCTTLGKADIEVGAIKEGYQGWEAINDGNTVYYCITEDVNWEVGYGVKTGSQIVRNLLSSNTGSLLSLDGKASVFCTYPSEKAVFLNADDNMYYPTSNINANKFIGDGSALTNLPNDNVWKDNGSSIEFNGDGSSSTQVVAENNGKQAKITQKSNGLTYFTGEGATYFGTEADEVAKVITNGTAQMSFSSNSVNAFQPLSAPEFIGDGAKITNIDAELNNLAPEAPTDGETYARNNKTWVSITDSSGIPDAPVDGLQYGRQDGEWTEVEAGSDAYTKTETNTLLDAKADKSTTYTKSEVDAQQNAQDADIIINNDEIARQQIEITNNTAGIEKNDSDINKNILDIATNTSNIATNTGNIASNTTAIGTLSGQVGQNTEDIAELQNSIFFSSAYSADYPSAPNRDPEDGNMYLQNLALFTYSYANATQIFVSKTDESGNVRQFTAIQAGDSVVLNEVDSPNYGRYELVSVEDVNDSYVVMNVIPKKGQGTVITGVKVAFQAFPKPDSAGIWTEADGVATYDGDVSIEGGTLDLRALTTGADFSTIKNEALNGINFDVYGSTRMSIKSGGVSTSQDMTVNGVNVGSGSQTGSVLMGISALSKSTDAYNTALGFQAGQNVVLGNSNVFVGKQAGTGLTQGSNNILIGNNAQPSSAPTVNNEVTIGNDDITVTRLKGEVQTTQDMKVNGITVGTGSGTGYNNTAIGYNALSTTPDAIQNTAIGYNAGLGMQTGSLNTFIGYEAGSTLIDGANNTFIGNGAQPSSTTVYGEVTIGNADVTTVRMGNGDLIYPMSSPILYTSILGTQADLPDGATVSLPFAGTGWSGDAFIAPKTGIYFLDASFQWSLINPIENQIYRNAYLGKNNEASFFQTSMGVDVQYPYGSINEFTWIGELNEGDAVRISAQQSNTDGLEQNIPTGFNNSVYANFAFLGTGDASTYVANKLVQQLATKVDKLEQKFRELK